MTTTTDFLTENQDKLEAFTKAITIAHGKNHPEVFDVRDAYVALTQNAASNANLDADFAKLRAITSDYAIPGDVCPTFEATYHMLEEADQLNAAK